LPGDLDVTDRDALARFIEVKQAEISALESEHSEGFAAAEEMLERREALRAAREKLSEAKEMVSPPSEQPQVPIGRALRDLQMTNAALTQDFSARFPEIRSQQDLNALIESNPERASEAIHYLQAVQPIMHARVQEAAIEQQQIAFAADAVQQDKAFLEANPHLKDPARWESSRRDAMEYLTEHLGLPLEEITAGWNGVGPLAGIRTLHGQQLIYDASRMYAAAKASKGRPRPNVPNVQRPGVARGYDAAREELVRALDRKLSNSHSLRDAAKLLAAKRATRR
jgi:hypothetical protein